MMNRTIAVISIFLLLAGNESFGQKAVNIPNLVSREDSLQRFADSMINGNDPAVRFRADSNFVRGLVRSLKTPYSFYYPFDSLQTISRLYAPDSTFRIFTWQLKKDEY